MVWDPHFGGNVGRFGGNLDRAKTYSLGCQLPILDPIVDGVLLRPRHINHPVDDDVRDVHALRAKLPRQRLAQAPEGELARREGVEEGGTLYGGRGAGDEEGGRVRGGLDRVQEGGEDFLGEKEEAAPIAC